MQSLLFLERQERLNLTYRLINQVNQKEKNGFKTFSINTGILLGPVELLASREFIIFSISEELVGERNN